MQLFPIGFVQSPRTRPFDDDWDQLHSVISLDKERFTVESLRGLEAFSHLEVIYHFHHVHDADVHIGARRPRGNPAWPEVGIFAQRGKDRPNRIGLSTCEIVSIEGTEITVKALDAIDGSPVLDLKPFMAEFAPRTPIRQPAWSHELMANYWNSATQP